MPVGTGVCRHFLTERAVASSIMYTFPFDMIAKDEVVGVTLQSLYFSRTVVI